MAKKQPRGKNKDNARRSKKKVSILSQEKVEYVDYKDVNLLRRFMSDRAKIRARRVTGNDAQQQREVARAIKNAREMALLPYANRVTTQRGGRDRGDRERDRGLPRPDGPPPRPTAPPPPPDGSAAEAAEMPDDAPVAVADQEAPESVEVPETAPEATGDEE
jgi:small subunit ribosomal protein S18